MSKKRAIRSRNFGLGIIIGDWLDGLTRELLGAGRHCEVGYDKPALLTLAAIPPLEASAAYDTQIVELILPRDFAPALPCSRLLYFNSGG